MELPTYKDTTASMDPEELYSPRFPANDPGCCGSALRFGRFGLGDGGFARDRSPPWGTAQRCCWDHQVLFHRSWDDRRSPCGWYSRNQGFIQLLTSGSNWLSCGFWAREVFTIWSWFLSIIHVICLLFFVAIDLVHPIWYAPSQASDASWRLLLAQFNSSIQLEEYQNQVMHLLETTKRNI